MTHTLALAALVMTLAGQPPRDGRLLVTVVDQTGAVIPDATVTVTGLDAAAKAVPIDTVHTTDKGVATISGLVPGRYSIQAEFAGFEPRVLPDVRVRSGDNRHVMVLAIKGLKDTVTVTRDAQAAAADRAQTFGTALTREQVEALSDDPDEMAQQLQEMAGPGAIIRVDSFEGGRLPPKSQIKSIHFTRDAFAAENHHAGGLFIDIITQPGTGPLRVGTNYRLRDGSLSGRSPFVPVKGPERTQNYGTSFGGSLAKDKASFSLFLSGVNAFQTPNVNAALPTGTLAQALNVRNPHDGLDVFGLFDYAITRDQTLRVNYSQGNNADHNLGIGAYDLPERAYSTEEHQHSLRVQEAGPLGRRFFTNTRIRLSWSDSSSFSAFEAPTIRVNDAFTSGGAQIAGGRRTKTMDLASDLDYVRGINSVRTGIQINGGHYASNDTSNYFGTYTFESLAAFEAGTPRGYTRRIGDPNIDYWNWQAGAYIQDDIRVRKGLTLSPGVRYELQTHLRDYSGFGPRFGITWAPFKSGKTTLRGSAGIFYDWLSSGTYEQALRVDGFRQQELNIVNPSYPDPGNIGLVPPINKYRLGSDLRMARNTRLSVGLDQAVTSKVRIGATYAHIRGSELLRGLNLNAPVNGVRPDPRFGNIIEVAGDASSRSDTLNVFLNVSPSGTNAPPRPPGAAGGPRWDWKRMNVGMNYFAGRVENDTDGAFNVPPTGSLAAEWGPASNDQRQRMSVFFATSALRSFTVNMNMNAVSGMPYTIRTGRDDNGDLIFNDRPAGVGRNTARAAGAFTVNANFVYTFTFGKRKSELPPGIFITASGGQVNVGTIQMDAARYRLAFVVNVQNLTNRTNYTGYSGVMTSPFFQQPTSVSGMRKVDVGINFNF